MGKDIIHKMPTVSAGGANADQVPLVLAGGSDAEQEVLTTSPSLLEKASATTFSLPYLYSK